MLLGERDPGQANWNWSLLLATHIVAIIMNKLINSDSPWMSFRSWGKRRASCKVGYLNVRTLRHRAILLPDGTLDVDAAVEIEILKQRMRDHDLYALALSEVRLNGCGEADVGDGYILVYSGAGSSAGVAVLLLPGAVRAWRADGGRTQFDDKGRVLRLFLNFVAVKAGGTLLRCTALRLNPPSESKTRFGQRCRAST